MLNWIVTIISFSLLMGGSSPSRANPGRVVAEITVAWTEEGDAFQRRYSGQGEMNKMLHYLRHLDPAEDSVPEEMPAGPSYDIRLLLSDGSTVQYVQKSLFYLQKDSGPWQRIDPEEAIRLPLILAAIEGDA